MTYYKSCAFINIGFGNGFFKHMKLSDEEMNKFCGYDAVYDVNKKKCVGKSLDDAHCTSVHKSYPREFSALLDDLDGTRNAVCMREGCVLDIDDKSRCKPLSKCMSENDTTTCENDPNCMYSKKCERRSKNSSDKVLQQCGFFGWFDNKKADVVSLCDSTTTRYNEKYNVCDRNY